MDTITKLKEKAYYCATNHEADDGNYIAVEDQIEAMKAYALLAIAEKLTVQN
jgi:hypothetical protein